MFKISLLVICFNLNLSSSHKIFEIFKKCKINDKMCLKETIENGLPKLINGLEEIDFPPLDPYFFGNSSLIEMDGFLQEYANIVCYGYENIEVLNIEFDLESCRIKFDYEYPKTEYEAVMHWKGVLVDNEIDISSNMKVQCANITTKHTLNCKKVIKDKIEYLEIVDGESDFVIRNISFKFEDFSNDDHQLNTIFDEYINRNLQTIVTLLQHMANLNEESMIESLTNKIFSKIPLSELFLN